LFVCFSRALLGLAANRELAGMLLRDVAGLDSFLQVGMPIKELRITRVLAEHRCDRIDVLAQHRERALLVRGALRVEQSQRLQRATELFGRRAGASNRLNELIALSERLRDLLVALLHCPDQAFHTLARPALQVV